MSRASIALAVVFAALLSANVLAGKRGASLETRLVLAGAAGAVCVGQIAVSLSWWWTPLLTVAVGPLFADAADRLYRHRDVGDHPSSQTHADLAATLAAKEDDHAA